MPKNPHLQKILPEIKHKLGIERARIHAKAKVLAAQAQVETEMGVYLLAATSGINLMGKLPQEKVDQVRQLLFQMGQQQESVRSKALPKQLVQKSITMTVGKTFTVNDPILPEKVIAEARMMAEDVYPVLYVFENSIRETILRVMQKHHGDKWWDSKASKPIREEVAKRIPNETQNPWAREARRAPNLLHGFTPPCANRPK